MAGATRHLDDLDIDEESSSRPGAPVDPGRLLHEVLAYWRIIPIIGALALVVGVLVGNRSIKSTYSARAALLWEKPNGNPQELVTSVDSVKLSTNLEEVRKRLKLKMGIEKLRDNVKLMFDRDSLLVVVGATFNSAEGAAALANTTVEVFLEYQQRVERAQREERLQLIEADLQVAQVNLANAREAQATFNKQLGVVDFDTERTNALQQALAMKDQAEMAMRNADAQKARGDKLAAEARKAPKTRSGGTTYVNQDEVALAAKKAQLAQESARLAPDHPTILALKAEISELATRAKSKVNVVSGGVSVSANQQYETLKSGVTQAGIDRDMYLQQHKAFKELEDQARARLQDLEKAEGQAAELANRVQLAQEQVQMLQKKRLVARDELRSIAPSFRIVTPATAPEKPDEMTGNRTAIKFPIIAMGLTVLALVAYALRGLKVHTAREAGFWANTPVVASSTWPRDPDMLSSLVDELSDHVPVARGTTLVVGARPNEVPLAREIAYWLGNATGQPQMQLVENITVMERREETAQKDGKGASDDDASVQVDESVAAGSTSTALVRTGQLSKETVSVMVAQAWDGPTEGPSLRRASRLAERVLVVVAAGTLSAPELIQLHTRLGRSQGIGLLLVGLNPAFLKLPDRVGQVDVFWSGNPAAA